MCLSKQPGGSCFFFFNTFVCLLTTTWTVGRLATLYVAPGCAWGCVCVCGSVMGWHPSQGVLLSILSLTDGSGTWWSPAVVVHRVYHSASCMFRDAFLLTTVVAECHVSVLSQLESVQHFLPFSSTMYFHFIMCQPRFWNNRTKIKLKGLRRLYYCIFTHSIVR